MALSSLLLFMFSLVLKLYGPLRVLFRLYSLRSFFHPSQSKRHRAAQLAGPPMAKRDHSGFEVLRVNDATRAAELQQHMRSMEAWKRMEVALCAL